MAEILQFPTHKTKVSNNMEVSQNSIHNDPELSKIMQQYENNAIQQASMNQNQNQMNKPNDLSPKTDMNGNVYLTLVFDQLAWRELQKISKAIDNGDINKTIGESIASRSIVMTNNFYTRNSNGFIKFIDKYFYFNYFVVINLLLFLLNSFVKLVNLDIMFNITMIINCVILLISHLHNNILYTQVKLLRNNQ